jgi:hypothetical protein
MNQNFLSKIMPPSQFNVFSMEDAIVLERKDSKCYDMMCDVCGLMCRRRIKTLPEYVSSRLKKKCCDVVQYKDGIAYLEILPTMDSGICPPISESFRVASDNVIAICRIFTGKHSLELNHKINSLTQALLFVSKKRLDYCNDLSEFELGLAHTVLFAPDILKKIDFDIVDGQSQLKAEKIVELAGPFVDAVIQKHRRIRGAFDDLGLPLREQAVRQMVNVLNDKHSRQLHKTKVKEVFDGFLFQRVIPFHKYSCFSDRVIAGAIYSLACTYSGCGEANIDNIARDLEVLAGGVNSVRVQMGEDISACERR